MSKRGNDELMEDISEATRRLEIYSQDMDYGVFLEDIKTQDAVIVWYILKDDLPLLKNEIKRMLEKKDVQ